MPRTSRSAVWRDPRRSRPRCCFLLQTRAASSPAANCSWTAVCAPSERPDDRFERAAIVGAPFSRRAQARPFPSCKEDSSMPKLKGKVALVTGGSSGMGFATAKRFIEEGAFVYISGRRQMELDKAVSLIGRSVAGVQGDVSKLADLDRLYARIASEKGK